MTSCTAHIADDPTGLRCCLAPDHPHGHRYESAYVADRHDRTEPHGDDQ